MSGYWVHVATKYQKSPVQSIENQVVSGLDCEVYFITPVIAAMPMGTSIHPRIRCT